MNRYDVIWGLLFFLIVFGISAWIAVGFLWVIPTLSIQLGDIGALALWEIFAVAIYCLCAIPVTMGVIFLYMVAFR